MKMTNDYNFLCMKSIARLLTKIIIEFEPTHDKEFFISLYQQLREPQKEIFLDVVSKDITEKTAMLTWPQNS